MDKMEIEETGGKGSEIEIVVAIVEKNTEDRNEKGSKRRRHRSH